MGTTQHKGSLGEKIAKEYLVGLGYIFVTSNWLCKGGEIDLIFNDQTTRVFVEVRLRSVTTFGDGDETVFYQKQKKLITAARMYQVKERYWDDARFDIVSIEIAHRTLPKITHIQDAFDTMSLS